MSKLSRRLLTRLICMLFASLHCAGVIYAEYDVKTHVSYVDKPVDDYQASQCRLDFYHPTDKKDFATVIWFHGGGLKSGKRYIPKELKGQGIAIAAVSYRLSPKVKSPAYLEDAASSIAWCFKHVESYGGSKKKIYVSGHSAGGYLAFMMGLDAGWLKKHGIDANDIAGIMPISGQTVTHSAIRAERGIPNWQPIVDDMAPLFHVRKDAPDILLVTGGRDIEMRGRYEENAYLWRLLQHVGHKRSYLYELEGYNHGSVVKGSFPLMLTFIRKRK